MMLLIWIGICISAIIIEVVTPTALVSIWFALGAAIAALTTFINVPLWGQIVCFVVISFVSMLIVRPMAARYLRGNTVATNADRCIGEIGVVIQDMTRDDWGEVKVGGAIWHAIPVDVECIKKEERVKVIAIEGAKLLVRRVS